MSELMNRWGEALPQLLTAVQQLAASAGVGVWPVAVVAFLAGLALLLAGVRLGPLLSGAAGTAIGWVFATRYAGFEGFLLIPPTAQAWLVAAIAGLACAFVPMLFPVLLGAFPGALLGLGIAIGGRPALGAAAGALVGGAVGFLLRRVLFALTAAAPGALLIDVGLIVLGGRFPSVATITNRPTALAALTAVLVVAGTAVQVSAQPSSGSERRGGGARARMREER